MFVLIVVKEESCKMNQMPLFRVKTWINRVWKSIIQRVALHAVFFLLTFHPVSSFAFDVHPDSLNIDRPKVALVLSGGGAKGFAHIGVLKVLEQEGIPVDIIVGTSIGSLVGGIYSVGYSAGQIETIVKSLNWEATLRDDVPRLFQANYLQELNQRYFLSLPFSDHKQLTLPGGVMKGQNVLNVFCGLLGDVPTDADFSKFPISFACVAADLETASEVVITDGFLPTALYSSMAIPIAFEPSLRDGRLLVDGGVVNNFPTDVAKKMGADIIIGVDIRNDSFTKEELKSIPNVVNRLIGFFDREKYLVNNSYCDLIIKPDITGFSASSFSRQAADTLILRGEKAAIKVVDDLLRIKRSFNLQSDSSVRDIVPPVNWPVTDIEFHGTHYLNPDFLNKTFGLVPPAAFSTNEIKEGIDRIYGLGGFKNVYYYFENIDNGKVLHVNMETERVSSLNVGFKVNSTDAAALMINTTQRNYKNIFGLVSLSGELSVNPSLDVTIESNRTRFPTMGINVKAKFQNINMYDGDDKLFKANIFASSGSLYFYQSLWKNYTFGSGVRGEYFSGDYFSRRSSVLDSTDYFDMFISMAYAYLSFDNMDDFYFPTKGTSAMAEFSVLSDWGAQSGICPILFYKMKNVIPSGNKTAFLVDVYARAMMGRNYPQVKSTLIGGEAYSQYFDSHIPFMGLPAVNLGARYVYMASLGIRFQIYKNQYLSVVANSLMQDSSYRLIDDAECIFGGGMRYAIKTGLGPLEIAIGYSNAGDKPTVSGNFGFWF